MKILKFLGCLATLMLILSTQTGCSSSGKTMGKEVLQADMLANLDLADFDETTISDVKYALLDTSTIALLGASSEIKGVIGDTVIISDMNQMGGRSRLLLFNVNDGSLIRTIDHVGNGPGEYNWIMNVVTDPDRSELILLGAAFKAHRYTTGDRFIKSYDMNKNPHGGHCPLGSVERGIHELDAYDGNLYIYQYDGHMQPVDTLFFPDYEPKYISVAFNQSDKEALINIVDTVFSLLPGEMQPTAVLSRGDKALTPEVERKVYLGRTDFEQADKEREAYIEFTYFINDGPRFTVCYGYGGKKYVDTYSRKSGKLIARHSFSYSDENPGIPVPYGDRTIHLQSMPYIHDGRFYGIVSEDETLGPDGEPSPDLNRALISWTVEGE